MAYRDSDCGKVFDTLFPEPQAEVLASVDSVIVARDTEDIVEALQTVIKLAPERIEGSSIKRLMDLLA
jgi:hypothetical protein